MKLRRSLLSLTWKRKTATWGLQILHVAILLLLESNSLRLLSYSIVSVKLLWG